MITINEYKLIDRLKRSHSIRASYIHRHDDSSVSFFLQSGDNEHADLVGFAFQPIMVKLLTGPSEGGA